MTRQADTRGELVASPAEARIPAGGFCAVEGCDRAHYAKGYCAAHWRRWKRNADPGPAKIASPVGGLCSFAGCERKHSTKGLCPSHYAQHRKGRPLAPLNDRVNPRGRDDAGNKRCSTCKHWLPEAAFMTVNKNSDGLSHCCADCTRERIVRRRYGIGAAQYDQLLATQGGTCAICRGTNSSGRSMAVDHDHSCCPGDKACGKCVRGLLCSNCNMGIGLLQEDIGRLESAIDYLKNHEARRG